VSGRTELIGTEKANTQGKTNRSRFKEIDQGEKRQQRGGKLSLAFVNHPMVGFHLGGMKEGQSGSSAVR
jgi:hypothetical protein